MRSRPISAAIPRRYRRMPATARRPISKRWRTAASMAMWRPAGPGTRWPACDDAGPLCLLRHNWQLSTNTLVRRSGREDLAKVVVAAGSREPAPLEPVPGLQIDRAMDVQALASGGLLDPDGHVLRRPASRRPRLMRGMHGIDKYDGFIGFEAVEKLIVAGDERLLPRFVELARHPHRLVIDDPKPVQQCDQPGVAVTELIILPQPGPDRIRTARHPCGDKGLQSRLLLVCQLARTAFMAELAQARQTLPLINPKPRAHGVIVQQKRPRNLVAIPAIIQKNDFGEAISRDRRQGASFCCGQKSRANHNRTRIQPTPHVNTSFSGSH